ncbi:MFS general substrate transporter [Xylariomycetidae sp. FL2044]|nr:MFS general substrate transporter [Xylariomycetidae sp. FL2044]
MDPAPVFVTDQNEKSSSPGSSWIETVVADANGGDPAPEAPSEPGSAATGRDRHSVYTTREKRLIVISAALGVLFAAWSAQIYLPSLDAAATDLDASVQQINLTVTAYMIFQAVAPIFIAGYADSMGRRPVYVVCFVLYIAISIALARTDTYPSLIALRSLQSIAISSTQALCQGVVADVSTSAERGQYAALVALPTILGPSLGPVIGGAIATYLGWRSIFWFLAITGALDLAILLLFFPETCRRIVGDGSILPRSSNRTLLQWLYLRRQITKQKQQQHVVDAASPPAAQSPAERRDGVQSAWARSLSALILLFEKEISLLSSYGGLLFAGIYAVGTASPTLFTKYYGLNEFQIGLTYLPLAAGSVVAAVLVGKGLNWNFQRHARRLGVTVDSSRQMDLAEFPLERARIEILLPPFVLSVVIVAVWGWAIETQASVAVPIVLIFFLGVGLSGAASVFNALITDIRPEKASAASASNNILKFLLGAAASAAIQPLMDRVGPGAAFTIIAALYIVLSPCLVVVVRKGMKWRQQIRIKDAQERANGMTSHV